MNEKWPIDEGWSMMDVVDKLEAIAWYELDDGGSIEMQHSIEPVKHMDLPRVSSISSLQLLVKLH